MNYRTVVAVKRRPSISACGVAAAADFTPQTMLKHTFAHSISRMCTAYAVVVVVLEYCASVVCALCFNKSLNSTETHPETSHPNYIKLLSRDAVLIHAIR